MPSLVIHGHFYQPPRENPFLDEVETEPGAAPYHDWNQRIERECYRAVVAARVLGAGGRIARVVNTLEWMSFNFGPTLLEWMEREANDTYRAILAADRASIERLGHGNAIAQPYHHTILPLASRRDKYTEVRWGIADFRRRYGRDPEGMWLPETALDAETLDVLATEGIRFTIVAPHQVSRIPAHGRPGRYRTASGKTIALCVYDAGLSHGIAFGGLLHDAGAWVDRMNWLGVELARESEATAPHDDDLPAPASATESQADGADAATTSARGAAASRRGVLLAAAADGETFGHHHRFGEMALARALESMRGGGWLLENFASFLARSPAVEDVEIVAPTSWSCVHGVERWRSDCGCRLNGELNPSQAWRAPLRAGLERLASALHARFETEGRALLGDPWQARDAYGRAVARGTEDLARFTREIAPAPATEEQRVRARELLEMERDTLRMFTSCAWFFDDIGGLEARQVLAYAARAIDLAGGDRAGLETLLLDELVHARSNDPRLGTGRDIYQAVTGPMARAPLRVAAAAVAARHLEARTPARPGYAEAEIVDEAVRVTEPRTGRSHTLRARVVKVSSTDIVTEVIDEQAMMHALHLGDLPERPRHAIQSRLRRSILPRCLTPDEIELLLAGDVTLGGLLRTGLLRTVERLETDPSGETIRLANELLDLFEQMEAKLPFDAQTAFWRIWERVSADRRASLHGLLLRLGFAERP